MGIAELLDKGGIVVWILLGYSVIGLSIVVERHLLFLRWARLPDDLLERLSKLSVVSIGTLAAGQLNCPEGRVIQAIYRAGQQGVTDLLAVARRTQSDEIHRMEAGLRTLGVLGHTAPLLGLLGTIMGMIKAFMVIEAAGGKVDAQALAGGIWEAMITTGVGLGVAIPILILLHFLEGAVERRAQSMEQCVARLLEHRANETDPVQTAAACTHHWEDVTDGL